MDSFGGHLPYQQLTDKKHQITHYQQQPKKTRTTTKPYNPFAHHISFIFIIRLYHPRIYACTHISINPNTLYTLLNVMKHK